ncbi:MAG: hypothetical protein RR922_01700 [Clostridia bacterium]
MGFKKTITISMVVAFIAFCLSGIVFAEGLPKTDDVVYDSVLVALDYIQKYSWPIAFLFFIFALYKFYILGAETLAHRIVGQRMVIGTALFLALAQWMPLIYAFIILADK